MFILGPQARCWVRQTELPLRVPRSRSAVEPLSVAVLGTGFGRKVHVPGLQAHPHTRVIGIFDRDPQKAAAVAEELGLSRSWHEVQAVLRDPTVEAVCISTPPHLHHDMAQQAIQAGKHVLLEKPITLSVDQARQLRQLAIHHQVVVIPDFEFRCVPSWQALDRLLQERWVGSIRSVNLTWQVQSRAKPDRPWNWYAQRELGGGVLGAIGSHGFDMVAWLLGPVEWLLASLQTRVTHLPDAETQQLRGVTSDDTDHLVLILRDGVPVQICLSSVTFSGRGCWLEIYGDRGTLVLGNSNLKDYIHGFQLQGSQGGEPLRPLSIPADLQQPQQFRDGRQAPFMGIVSRWVESIRHGIPPQPSLDDGLYSQLLMDLSWQSHDRQEWVRVPESI